LQENEKCLTKLSTLDFPVIGASPPSGTAPAAPGPLLVSSVPHHLEIVNAARRHCLLEPLLATREIDAKPGNAPRKAHDSRFEKCTSSHDLCAVSFPINSMTLRKVSSRQFWGMVLVGFGTQYTGNIVCLAEDLKLDEVQCMKVFRRHGWSRASRRTFAGMFQGKDSSNSYVQARA